MNVLAIDPGAAPGYAALCESGEICHISTRWIPEAMPSYDTVVTESQWVHTDRKRAIDPANIIKLARTCGMQLMRAIAHQRAVAYVLPVDVWKAAAMSDSPVTVAHLPKEVYCERFALTLTDTERAMVSAASLGRAGPRMDLLDAIAIGRGFLQLQRKNQVSQWLQREVR